MSEMPINDTREHVGEVVGRARYSGQETILTHYGTPTAVVISFEEYQPLKHARYDSGNYQLPTEITSQISESCQHPSARATGLASLRACSSPAPSSPAGSAEP